MSSWYEGVQICTDAGEAYVLVTVLAVSGSTPRNTGTKMVISREQIFDTIGGGQLEYLVSEKARALLNQGVTAQEIDHMPLAVTANQCCGGSVTVLFECFVNTALKVTLFGAGHVGAEVYLLLKGLRAQVDWYDSRDQFAAQMGDACHWQPNPIKVIADMDPSMHTLVMTHDHLLDYDLIYALLERGCVSIGLIGSETKWGRFRARLSDAGLSDAALSLVRCPVGDRDIPRKDPPAVAIAIVAELLKIADQETPRSLSWRQVRSSLVQDD